MTIIDDAVFFGPGEFAALTQFTQEALIHYYGERTVSAESALSDVINREIQAARASYTPRQAENRVVSTLEEAIARATPEQYAEVLPDINRIKAVLGIVDP